MHHFRRLHLALLVACALLAVSATPSLAVVGGSNAAPGEYPSIARVTFGKGFLCTGTLVAPNYVLSAGHCGSVTGAVASPASWPAALVDVRVGGTKPNDGELVPVKRVVVHPKYFVNKGYDIALIELQRPSVKAPVQVSGSGETSLWSAGTMETVVGWGATEEDGSSATTLQKAQVPVTTDSYCSGAYSEFDPVSMICAGYPEGGIDTCQGDSGGPMYGRTSTGVLRVVGATSFGDGCARPGRPGVYARVGDATLREWIRGIVPAGVA